MSIQKRIQMCRAVEKLQQQRAYGMRLGLENDSTFHGKMVTDLEEKYYEEINEMQR